MFLVLAVFEYKNLANSSALRNLRYYSEIIPYPVHGRPHLRVELTNSGCYMNAHGSERLLRQWVDAGQYKPDRSKTARINTGPTGLATRKACSSLAERCFNTAEEGVRFLPRLLFQGLAARSREIGGYAYYSNNSNRVQYYFAYACRGLRQYWPERNRRQRRGCPPGTHR